MCIRLLCWWQAARVQIKRLSDLSFVLHAQIHMQHGHDFATLHVPKHANAHPQFLVFCRVLRDLKGARVVAGALVEASEDEVDTDGNAGSWMDLSIMMEEYLDGPEVDVDLVLSRRQPVYGAVTDNWPTVEPYFNETGSNCPSLLPRNQQMELVALGIQAVQCMGFDAGAASTSCPDPARTCAG